MRLQKFVLILQHCCIYKTMKKLIPLFSTTLILTISHILCCFLPYMALFSGILGLSYFTYLVEIRVYIAFIQVIILSYNFYYIYCKIGNKLIKPQIMFWLMFVISILAFIFPYYNHAKSQKANTFGKNIISKIK